MTNLAQSRCCWKVVEGGIITSGLRKITSYSQVHSSRCVGNCNTIAEPMAIGKIE